MANAAAAALLAPVVVPMANSAGTPVVPIAMSAPLATTFVLWIINGPPTLTAYGFGYFTQWEAFTAFFLRAFLRILILSLCMALWYPVVGMSGNVDNMKGPARLTTAGVRTGGVKMIRTCRWGVPVAMVSYRCKGDS